MFRTEVNCYSDLFPRMNSLASEHEMGEVRIPACYYASDDQGIILMENLKLAGYGMEDKTKGTKNLHHFLVLK